MARRRSAIVHRFSRMQGLPPEEKDLLLRIGELVDSAINNRTPTNPVGIRGHRTSKPTLPIPTNVTVNTGVRSVILSWDAVDSSELLNYRVQITNLDTGVTETKLTYTNELVYKGRIGGNYRAFVSSVSRRGTQSAVKDLSFFVADDVMLLEGTKNSFNAINTLVSEDIGLIKGHKLFIWGAFTLDRLIAGPAGNSQVVLQLLEADGADARIENATLIQEVPMYAASETAMNLDTEALGSGIIRPPPDEGVTKIRGTSFNPQSVMFTPISIADEDANTTKTFFIRLTNRDAENDTTGLSISIWSTYAGAGAQIPSDPFVGEPAIVTNDLKSIDLNDGLGDTGDEYIRGEITAPFRVLGAVWSFAIWFKPDTITTPITLVDRDGVVPGIGDDGNRVNGMTISYQKSATSTILDVLLGGGPEPDDAGSPTDTALWRRVHQQDPLLGDSNFPNAPGSDKFNDLGWHFLVVTYINGLGVRVYINGTFREAGGTGGSNDTDTITMDRQTEQTWVFGTIWDSISTGGVYDGTDPTAGNNPPEDTFEGRIHSAGAWNTRLGLLEVQELYDSGNGTTHHWRTDTGDYLSARNLIHYWQFGAVDDTLPLVGRDTGFAAFDGDIDTTDVANISDSFGLANVVDDFPTEDT